MKKRYSKKLGNLFFVLPVLVISIVVVYGFVVLNSPGTIVIRAENTSGQSLQVGATVNNMNGMTPWTVGLHQGTYTVNYSSVAWYDPPLTRTVSVTPGSTVYAIALYQPTVRVIAVTPQGFNSTGTTALHSLTPVVWLNPSTSSVSFSGSPIGTQTLSAGQNFTYIFTKAGTYNFNTPSSNQNFTISVS